MSSYTRDPVVQVRQSQVEEWRTAARKAQEAAKRQETLKKQIEQMRAQAAKRDKEQQIIISDMTRAMEEQRRENTAELQNLRSEMAKKQQESLKRIAETQKKITADMNDRFAKQAQEIEKVRTELGHEISRVSHDLSTRINDLRSYVNTEIQAVRENVEKIGKVVDDMVAAGQNNVSIADVYVDSARGIYESITELNLLHAGISQAELSGLLARISDVENALNSMRDNPAQWPVNGAVERARARDVYEQAAELQQRALAETLRWQAMFDAAMACINNSLDSARNHAGDKTTTVKITDYKGEVHDESIVVDKWSNNAATEIVDTLTSLRKDIESGSTYLTADDLEKIMNVAEVLGTDSLHEAIAVASSQLYSSQYRADMMSQLDKAMREAGYIITTPNTYIANDHTQANRIAARHVSADTGDMEVFVTLRTINGGTGIDMETEVKNCHKDPHRAEMIEAFIKNTFKKLKNAPGAGTKKTVLDSSILTSAEFGALPVSAIDSQIVAGIDDSENATERSTAISQAVATAQTAAQRAGSGSGGY